MRWRRTTPVTLWDVAFVCAGPVAGGVTLRLFRITGWYESHFYLAATATLVALVLGAAGGFLGHALLFTRPERRIRAGHCPNCNYDLRRDFSRGCPECGWHRETHGP